MSLLETILSGIVVFLISLMLGKLWGEVNIVTDKRCKERQESCTANMCNTLDSIKEGQKEMREDIKDIKNHLFKV